MCQVESVAGAKVATEDRSPAAGPQTNNFSQEADKSSDVQEAKTAEDILDSLCPASRTNVTLQVLQTFAFVIKIQQSSCNQ